ncbi:GLPGLI family protein [Spirosoma soli]|uniref:GLPGLI family protein n=1 Tax=Spirosoma soli TaxID=1770529 RepID=A0ABW5M0W5_9BACT
MKFLVTLAATGLLALSACGQTPVSGKITYEGMRRIDMSQMRTVVNGQEVRPGSPGAPDAPEGGSDRVISFTQKLVFAGTMAREERDRPQNFMMRRMGDQGAGGSGQRDGQPRTMNMTPPFEQTTFLDLANRKAIEVMTVKKDSATQTYRTERSMPAAEGWQLSDKTKKIAGYVCHKATVTRRMSRRQGGPNSNGAAAQSSDNAPEETYTIWYTTDLPFTYSPVARLTPEKGVVLQIESDSESFKATGVSTEAVAEATVQPPKEAKPISDEEMSQLRRRTMADFRQKMMNAGAFPGRN